MSAHFLKTVFFVIVALFCAVDAYLETERIPDPAWWSLTAAILLNFTTFVWYRRDAIERTYQRSVLLNMAVVAIPPLTVPIYILKRTPAGGRLRAIWGMLGYAALIFLVAFVGGIVGEIIA